MERRNRDRDTICAYQCSTRKDYCVVGRGCNPKTCPIKEEYRKVVLGEGKN